MIKPQGMVCARRAGRRSVVVVMKNRRGEKERQRLAKKKDREREREGCVRTQFGACDTSYLGTGPSLSWGVAESAALVAHTPPH